MKHLIFITIIMQNCTIKNIDYATVLQEGQTQTYTYAAGGRPIVLGRISPKGTNEGTMELTVAKTDLGSGYEVHGVMINKYGQLIKEKHYDASSNFASPDNLYDGFTLPLFLCNNSLSNNPRFDYHYSIVRNNVKYEETIKNVEIKRKGDKIELHADSSKYYNKKFQLGEVVCTNYVATKMWVSLKPAEKNNAVLHLDLQN